MSEVTIIPEPKINATITNEGLLSDGQTWDSIEGTWNDHDDTWASPRLGMTKDSANNVTVTNDPL